MAEIRPEVREVTDRFAVAHQLRPEDMQPLADAGYRLVINNRPDGEEPGQPAALEVQAAAAEAGMAYIHLPFSGPPTEATADRMAEAMGATEGKVIAHCRSGTRSINAWALGQARAGADRRELAQAGAAAGYDLSATLSR